MRALTSKLDYSPKSLIIVFHKPKFLEIFSTAYSLTVLPYLLLPIVSYSLNKLYAIPSISRYIVSFNTLSSSTCSILCGCLGAPLTGDLLSSPGFLTFSTRYLGIGVLICSYTEIGLATIFDGDLSDLGDVCFDTF